MRSMIVMLTLLTTGPARGDDAASPAGTKMALAATKWLASLSEAQRSKAQFSFGDGERVNWHYIPLQDAQKNYTRKGIPLDELSEEQKALAQQLLRTGTSASGFQKALAIMKFEALLGEQEKDGPNVRKPGWYFISVFGTPGPSGRWAWRWEGHHLALNFTIDNGQVVSATPAFFGCNPVRVQEGPDKGKRTLPEEEDLAKELFNSLTEEQKKSALQPKHFDEIQGRTPSVGREEPRGLLASQMTPGQRGVLNKLIQSYTNRLCDDAGKLEWKAIEAAGVDQVRFAFTGGTGPGQQHTYRVEGPTFQIQYLNVQNDSIRTPANHIHSVYRNRGADFGLGK